MYNIIFGSGELGRNNYICFSITLYINIHVYVPLTFYVIRKQKSVACVFPTLTAALLFLSAFTSGSHH